MDGTTTLQKKKLSLNGKHILIAIWNNNKKNDKKYLKHFTVVIYYNNKNNNKKITLTK